MRIFTIAIGVLAISSCWGEEPTGAAIFSCGREVQKLSFAQKTVSKQTIMDLPASNGFCVIADALPLGDHQTIVLVNENGKGQFAVNRYALGSWKLEMKREIEGTLPHDNYLAPDADGKAFSVVSLSDETHLVAARRVFETGGEMKLVASGSDQFLDHVTDDTRDVPLASVPGASLFSGQADQAILLRRTEGITTKIPGWASTSCIAGTRDAVLTLMVEQGKVGQKPTAVAAKVKLFAAESGKEVNHMTVPVGFNDDVICIALWHDKMALLSLPYKYLLLDLDRHTTAVVNHEFKVFNKDNVFPLWVMGR